jgi:hypothetical protein
VGVAWAQSGDRRAGRRRRPARRRLAAGAHRGERARPLGLPAARGARARARRRRLRRRVRRLQRRGAATVDAIRAVVEDGGARFVDGGIVGPPPERAGTTRLYLSGPDAGAVAAAFDGTCVEAPVLGTAPGTASALKMAYAAWTKGTAALLLAIGATARANGVEEALVAEWERSQPGLVQRSAQAVDAAAHKGWRWVGEMDEIAATFAAAGEPDGFHRAAAEVFRGSR